MSTRHLFAGVNSPLGFYSCFQSIIDQEKAARIIYIKGGPGTGKSTLMKKIASLCEDMGEPIEEFHCSSDPKSLDGVHIVNRKIALMDSTAPHIMEPKYPMVNGELFNAAECLDHRRLQGKEEMLAKYCAVKDAAYKRGFQYLKATEAIRSAIDKIYADICDMKKAHKTVDNIIKRHMQKPSKLGNGTVRPLFLSVVTPDGFVSYLDGLCKNGIAVTIKEAGNPQAVFTRLVDHAVRNGYDVEIFLCPMNPKVQIENIHIPELQLWISAHNGSNASDRLAHHWDDLDHLKLCEKGLIDGAVKAFNDAKQAHRAMENDIFIPAMDFEKLDKRVTQLLESLNLLQNT